MEKENCVSHSFVAQHMGKHLDFQVYKTERTKFCDARVFIEAVENFMVRMGVVNVAEERGRHARCYDARRLISVCRITNESTQIPRYR